MPTSVDHPSISAVIPAFNRERTLDRAIQSALEQSASPREIIVVDDGSTDGTRQAAERFGSAIRYVHQSNAGASAARNRGVREARGDWIAFLDSDDYWFPDHLKRVGEAIAATSGRAVIYFTDLRRTEAQGRVSHWEHAGFSIEGPFEFVEDATDWVMKPIVPAMLQGSVFRREWLLSAGGLCEKLQIREDTHLIFRACIEGSACAVACCGAQMTAEDRSGGRLTASRGTRTPAYWQCSVLLWDDLLSRWPELPRRHRIELRRRLAQAHLRSSRFAWREGRRWDALRAMAQGLRAQPRGAAELAWKRWARSRAPSRD